MRFADLLRPRGGDAPGSAGVKATLERAEGEAQAALARLDALTADRARALVEDDDKGLDRIERDVALARRDLDRSELAVVELQRRLEETIAAEAQAELDAILARGEAATVRYVELVRGRYADLAGKLRDVLAEMKACDALVDQVNHELRVREAGRYVEMPDMRARRQPEGEDRQLHLALHTQARLPSAEDPTKYLWPPPSQGYIGVAMAVRAA